MKNTVHTLKALVALLLTVCLVTGVLPMELIGDAIALAEPVGAAPAANPESGDLLTRAQAQAEEVLTENGWRFVVLQPENWAVVVGYEGAETPAMTVPDVLGGADTVGIAAGALAGLIVPDTITVPGNVTAIGAAAFPTGVTVKAVAGAWALSWAQKNRYPTASASDYDFRNGVIDMTGTRSENFRRISEHEVWLRPLEAARLTKGSLFFLMDPANQYQISYYRVTDMSGRQDGFVVMRCETPKAEEMLNQLTVTGERMMVDMSTVTTAPGVTLAGGSSRAIGGGIEQKLGLNLSASLDLTDNLSLTTSGGSNHTWEGSYSIGLFSGKEVEIKQTDKLDVTVELEYKHDDFDQYYESQDKISSAKKVKELWKNKMGNTAAAESTYGGGKKNLNMGSAVIFSLAGWVNITASLRLTLEFSGKVSVSVSPTTTTV